MIRIAGVFGQGARWERRTEVDTMLDARRGEPGGRSHVEVLSGGLIGVADGGHDAPKIASPGGRSGWWVALSGRLSYRADLRRRLTSRGIEAPVAARGAPAGGDDGTLVARLLHGMGERGVQHLEGSFTFVAWNPSLGRLLAARDPEGRRPLYWYRSPDALVVSSTLSGLEANPSVPVRLDPGVLATSGAGVWAEEYRTWMGGVKELPPGHLLTWTVFRGERCERFWMPPAPGDGTGRSEAEASEELRELLIEAVGQQLPPDDVAVVWLSGGRDSPSVYAMAKEVLRREGRPSDHIRSVSMSFPAGDPGRENEIIEAVLTRGGEQPRWLDVDQLPLLPDDPVAAAGRRDRPWAHAMEGWNRALARESRAAGGGVVLDGNGGDLLFHVSNVYLADLLRRGKASALLGEWRARRAEGLRSFLEWTVRPLMTRRLSELGGAVGGRDPLSHYMQGRFPPWFRRDFVRREGLVERERDGLPWTGLRRGARLTEVEFLLGARQFAQAAVAALEIASEEGLVIRSPFHDRRVMEFALRRPLEERSGPGDTKRLLRRAMEGHLPPSVTAPREGKGGLTVAAFERGLRRDLARHRALLAGRRHHLADLGIVEPRRFIHALERFVEGWVPDLALPLLLTAQVEFWLRAREGG